MELLDPDAVVRADAAAVAMGAQPVVSGVEAVAQNFNGRAQGGPARRHRRLRRPGAGRRTGQLKVAFGFVLTDGRISEIELIADPEVLATLDVS